MIIFEYDGLVIRADRGEQVPETWLDKLLNRHYQLITEKTLIEDELNKIKNGAVIASRPIRLN